MNKLPEVHGYIRNLRVGGDLLEFVVTDAEGGDPVKYLFKVPPQWMRALVQDIK